MSLIVKSQIKEEAKKQGVCISDKVYIEISNVVRRTLSKAARRALANGRKTIKVRDI